MKRVKENKRREDEDGEIRGKTLTWEEGQYQMTRKMTTIKLKCDRKKTSQMEKMFEFTRQAESKIMNKNHKTKQNKNGNKNGREETTCCESPSIQ